MLIRVLFILYCFEAGLFFLVVPWTKFWGQNPLLHSFELFRLVADNAFFRGMVSGFGLVHFIVGIAEIVALLSARGARAASESGNTEQQP